MPQPYFFYPDPAPQQGTKSVIPSLPAPGSQPPPRAQFQSELLNAWSRTTAVVLVAITRPTSADPPTPYVPLQFQLIRAWIPDWPAQSEPDNASWNVAPPSNPPPRRTFLYQINYAWQPSWGAQEEPYFPPPSNIIVYIPPGTKRMDTILGSWAGPTWTVTKFSPVTEEQSNPEQDWSFIRRLRRFTRN